MRIAIANFQGEIPRLHPRLLPENFAQLAQNTRLKDGTITPIRAPRLVERLADGTSSFILFQNNWLAFPGEVDAAQGPVAQERLYYTGDGAPKMRVGATVYPLRLDPPAAAPSLTLLSAAGANPESVTYCYTFVTGFGEESPPSPLSAAVLVTPSVTVRLTGFSAAPGGRNITHRRIYRSQTGISGVTDLYFVAEIPLATTTFDHSILTQPLQEVLPSADYDAPRDTLSGLISLPNGIMAAFDGRELFFSEPFRPHAWPQKYSLTTDSEIIGLAAFGSTLVVLTSVSPYIVQGTQPDSMVMERVDKDMPCLSRRGIVDIGYAALFPTSDGLGMITANGPQIVTANIFTREQWLRLSPETFVAEQYDGRYVFTYLSEAVDLFDGGTPLATGAFIFEAGGPGPLAGETALFYDFGAVGSVFGAQRVGMIDVTGAEPFFIQSNVSAPTAMYSDPGSGRLYMLIDGRDILEWDGAASARSVQVWRSKLFHLATYTSFGAIIVESDEEAVGDNAMKCRVYADDVLQREVTVCNDPQRLPGNRLAKRWEIEIESNFPITAIRLAGSMDELMQ